MSDALRQYGSGSCGPSEFDHDYSLSPHNTPLTPRDSAADGCQSCTADGPPWCKHDRVYEVVVYQVGTHEWVRLLVCGPCAATLRRRHQGWGGPGGRPGLFSVKSVVGSGDADREKATT